jgi:hypothetical protein
MKNIFEEIDFLENNVVPPTHCVFWVKGARTKNIQEFFHYPIYLN